MCLCACVCTCIDAGIQKGYFVFFYFHAHARIQASKCTHKRTYVLVKVNKLTSDIECNKRKYKSLFDNYPQLLLISE